MKEKRCRHLFILSVLILLFCGMFTVEAKAASYRMLPTSRTKIGNNYVYRDDSRTILATTAAGQNFKITADYAIAGVTNGNIILCTKRSSAGASSELWKYVLSTKKAAKITTLSAGVDIVAYYGSKVYYTDTANKIRVYNVSTKKTTILTNIDSAGKVFYSFGKYFYGTNNSAQYGKGLYCVNMSTGKKSKLKNSYDPVYFQYGANFYYPRRVKAYGTNSKGEKVYYYKIYVCNTSAATVQAISKSFKAVSVSGLTLNTVTYYNSNGVRTTGSIQRVS